MKLNLQPQVFNYAKRARFGGEKTQKIQSFTRRYGVPERFFR